MPDLNIEQFGILALAFFAVAIAAAAGLGWLQDRLERSRYEASLSFEDRERMRGFCLTGRTWRDFREFERRSAARLPGTRWEPVKGPYSL